MYINTIRHVSKDTVTLDFESKISRKQARDSIFKKPRSFDRYSMERRHLATRLVHQRAAFRKTFRKAFESKQQFRKSPSLLLAKMPSLEISDSNLVLIHFVAECGLKLKWLMRLDDCFQPNHRSICVHVAGGPREASFHLPRNRIVRRAKAPGYQH